MAAVCGTSAAGRFDHRWSLDHRPLTIHNKAPFPTLQRLIRLCGFSPLWHRSGTCLWNASQDYMMSPSGVPSRGAGAVVVMAEAFHARRYVVAPVFGAGEGQCAAVVAGTLPFASSL